MDIGTIERIEVIDEEMARVLRAKTGADRLRIASGMFAAARRMLLCSLAAEHPDWEPRQVIEETARRLSHGAG
jgi:Rv0078B-related antitoxin